MSAILRYEEGFALFNNLEIVRKREAKTVKVCFKEHPSIQEKLNSQSFDSQAKQTECFHRLYKAAE